MPSVSQKRAQGKDKHGVIPAIMSLQAFQMSSPAYSFHRTVPRAAAVVLECELDGDRAINSPGRCRNRREEREHWLVIAPIPPPESPEAWRRASEGGAEGQGPSDGRMGYRNHGESPSWNGPRPSNPSQFAAGEIQ